MSWEYNNESAAQRKARIAREVENRRAKGEPFEPIVCEVKRGIPAKTFWGVAWGENLESYSDYEHRLPRGRTYLRGGNVFDLEINEGNVFAYVTGGEIYEVTIDIEPMFDEPWAELKQRIAGKVTNVVDLMAGDLGAGVMEAVTDRELGLFPSPSEIRFSCSCPDWADMCKHVASVMYAVGVRLDQQPELLFKLRGVDHHELIDHASTDADLSTDSDEAGILEAGELSELFGIDLGDPESAVGE
ncbi:SWIM zinc finger family protein [Sulfuriroseicoccus oceanibius]|uniref:SWIM zinc finger family protein n=1 Tax=Sulfuriroseicoccus oceanibius TaxID=2707525 RepID=A0A6B3L539_9BACT|nr:SWIM zinc finger family protein [Sulfuriroseicoccus oceanibius]QQL45412.1 SWIM zinc finger family protein [Sulfuriroseicoccus oceanibius]